MRHKNQKIHLFPAQTDPETDFFCPRSPFNFFGRCPWRFGILWALLSSRRPASRSALTFPPDSCKILFVAGYLFPEYLELRYKEACVMPFTEDDRRITSERLEPDKKRRERVLPAVVLAILALLAVTGRLFFYQYMESSIFQ